jgi:hypothetical protein
MRLPAALLVLASYTLTESSARVLERSSPYTSSPLLAPRHGDEHGHGHGGMSGNHPLEHINETEVLMYHDPDPVSYYQYDFAGIYIPDDELANLDSDAERAKVVTSPEGRHGPLAVLHALVMTTSYLFLLPIGQSTIVALVLRGLTSAPFSIFLFHVQCYLVGANFLLVGFWLN